MQIFSTKTRGPLRGVAYFFDDNRANNVSVPTSYSNFEISKTRGFYVNYE